MFKQIVNNGKYQLSQTCSPERSETKETDIKAAPGPAESHRTTKGLKGGQLNLHHHHGHGYNDLCYHDNYDDCCQVYYDAHCHHDYDDQNELRLRRS